MDAADAPLNARLASSTWQRSSSVSCERTWKWPADDEQSIHHARRVLAAIWAPFDRIFAALDEIGAGVEALDATARADGLS